MSRLYYIKDGLVRGRICPQNKPGGLGNGWIWFPFTTAQKPSRKVWDTPEQAISDRIWGGRIVEVETFDQALQIAEQEKAKNLSNSY